MTADTVMYTPDGDKIKGIEDWKQYAQVFLTALSDINLAIEDIIAEGDTVVARWKASARHSGDLEGIPPSN
jgi:predicted ester cyclase